MPTLPSAVEALGADLPKIGLAETIYTSGGLMTALPFVPGNGRLAHTYNQEGTNPRVGAVPTNGMVPQGVYAVTRASVDYKRFGGDVPLDPRMRGMGDPVQSFYASVGEQQAKSMRYLIEDYLINGDVTDPNQFSGIRKLIDSSMKIDNGGGPLTKAKTDRAWLKLHQAGRATAIWTGNDNVTAQCYEFLGAYATAAEKMADAFGAPALHLHDRPLLTSNFGSAEDATGAADANGSFTSLFLIGLGGRGVTGVIPPEASDVFQMSKIPPSFGFPHEGLRLMFDMALALESKFYAVQIYNIANS